MRTQVTLIFVAAVLAAASVASAQEVDPLLLNDISPQMELVQERRRDRERSEDMAILSQILYEDLVRLYLHDPHAATASANAAEQSILDSRVRSEEVGRPLSEYLPGYGVVVQATAPPPQRDVAAGSNSEAETLSRWEATRRRMRGEAVYDEKTCAACHRVESRQDVYFFWRSLFHEGTDPHRGIAPLVGAARRRPTQEQLIAALTDVLSEAGGRLRHVQPDERITLSLQYAPETREPTDESFFRRVYLDLVGELPTPGEVQSFLADRSADKRTKVVDRLLEQSGPAATRRRWKEQSETPAGAGKDTGAGQPRATSALQGNEARAAIDDLILHRLEQETPLSGGVAALPGRLSVTATKRQIDALAAGALDREGFGKQVVVRIGSGGGE